MPKVYMYPNPDLGKMTRAGVPEKSVYMADPVAAHLPGVEAVLGSVATSIAARATGRLMTVKAGSDRSEGAGGSFIELEHGALDYHVILNDERSDKAAAKINKDHGILNKAMPAPRPRLARKKTSWDNRLVKDPVAGGYPSAAESESED